MTLFGIIAGIILLIFFLNILSARQEEHLREEGLMPADGQGTDEHVRMLMQKGHKIQAIKVYRQIHGGGLKEAKEAVEQNYSKKEI